MKKVHTPAYTIINKKKLPKSQIELEIQIESKDLSPLEKEVLKDLIANAEIPGFRKGHAPEPMIRSKIGDLSIFERAAENAIEIIAPNILDTEAKNSIGMPRIAITKIAIGNPLVFTMTIAIFPEVTLPDYKKIAETENKKKKEEITVTEKEVDEAIDRIMHMMQGKHEHKEGEKHDHGPITDEIVKKLGDFKDVADFRVKLTLNIKQDKEHKARDKKRVEIAEAIISKTKAEIPEVLVESELNKMESQFSEDVARMGVKMEDYLKHVKKTVTDLRREWTPDSEKRAMLQLVLGAIAEKEKIVAEEKDVLAELEHMMKHYKDADPLRARAYIESLLRNEKVLKFLETQI
ncbi:MAG: trigger factor [Candidatus Paceibacterota bacterium]|jgi:FKBP-type peptidyl-prolyl cis-trans isomerase (trigger factor)